MRLCFFLMLFSMPVWAFTPTETNQVVRSLLNRIMADAYDDNLTLEGRVLLPEECIDTWETFIGGTHAPGWSFEDKKGAFDWYLSTLGTKDCRALPQGQKDYVLGAISQCHELHYTNAVPYLQALAFNTNGVHRDLAIDNAIQLGRVDDEMTRFVESVITNRSTFTRPQRGGACSEYSRKLAAMTNNPTPCLYRAGAMFYRNRFFDIAGAVAIDQAVGACYPVYAVSSNRLLTANWVLSREDCNIQTRRYFSTVTNQLLSSGRSLVQLTIGEGGNE